jgi:multidrug efflux pump subunit AcrA (membrane-fusion protein)
MEASWATSDARSQYRAALIELRRTRALVKAAEAVERAAMLAYEATDYTT